MEKVFGATERHDQLVAYGHGAVLVFGYGEDDGGYDWRHTFTHRPTSDEVMEVIVEHVNGLTDQRILSGFVWDGKGVWLSSENQFNFKAAFDVAVQTGGATLPVKFKLGEDADGVPVYHVFADMAEFSDFYTKAIAFIMTALTEGWEEKDAAKQWVETLNLD